MRIIRLIAAASFGTATLFPLTMPETASAQDYFIPGQQRGPAAAAPSRPAPPRPTPTRTAPPRLSAPPVQIGPDAGQQQAVEPPGPQVNLPPQPELPPLAKGVNPPAPVIGVLGVPEIMRAASAAQQVEKVIGERREKLNEDAQKEQNTWREMQQSLANERTKLSPEQIRSREKELQERITNSQKLFRDRNTTIQQAAQYGLAQIERTLIGVIRQVAESRGMNLVLHRAQVALNINEFDITDEVTQQLNKVMSSVQIPPDGVSPVTFAKEVGEKAPATPASAAPVVATPAPATGATPEPAAPAKK